MYRNLNLVVACLAGVLLSSSLFSCGGQNDAKPPVSTVAADERYADNQYLAKVYGSFVTQNELQHIALNKARSSDVKQLAQTLLDRYEALNRKIEAVAEERDAGVDIKKRFDQENHIEFLSKEPQASFDEEYINILLREHKKFLEDFRLTGINTKDPQVNAIATEVLKAVTKSYSEIGTLDVSQKTK